LIREPAFLLHPVRISIEAKADAAKTVFTQRLDPLVSGANESAPRHKAGLKCRSGGPKNMSECQKQFYAKRAISSSPRKTI